MKQLKTIVLLSALACGLSHAGTVPCNGFKIDFKNQTGETIVLDNVNYTGGSMSTTGALVVEPGKDLLYTVNQSIESGIMNGEFLFHTVQEPNRELRLSFDLTNKSMICELGNIVKQGNLETSVYRMLGGVNFHIKN